MKLIRYAIPLLALALTPLSALHAQTSFDLNMGFGTARAGSNGAGIDNLNSANALGACAPNSGDSNCQATPALGGFFLGLGGDLIFQKHFGIGAEVNFTPARSDYGPLQYRQTFYDFNGIYLPVNEKRVQLQIQGGIGGAKTGFGLFQSSCIGTALCSSSTQPVGSTNHFQAHVGIGFQIFLTQHIFVRPQFDLHYVPNFTDQFGRNAVPAATVWVGYSFGDRE